MGHKISLSKSSPRRFGRSKSPYTEARKLYKDVFSPGSDRKIRSKSPNTRRRFSTDMIFSPLRSRLECPSSAVGRRLSKDSGGCNSPPDINSRICSNVDVRFQQGRSHLDVRSPDTRASGSSLNIPRFGSSSNTIVSSPRYETGGRRLEVSSVQERLNTIGSRLGSLSSTDVSSRPQKLSRSRSKSPIPSIINISFPSSSDSASQLSTVPKYRGRVRSDTNARDAVQSRPRLRTPSPTGIQIDAVQHRDLNSTSGRSRSLDNNRGISQENEIKPSPEPEGNVTHHQKLKRSDFTLPYESIIEVNVTCCDSTPEKTNYSTTYNASSRNHDSISQEHINVSGSSPSPYSSLKRQQFRRRQSHQPRLETVYTPQHQIVSPSSSSQSSTKEFLVPIQRHDSSSSSSRSPSRRRHQSHPIRTDLIPQEKSSIATSSSIPDVSVAVSPNRHRQHRRHRKESSHDCDEVFDDIPPPPPPPFCHSRNGESPLERLNKEELVALWRSSESELRSNLLRAIRAKEVTDPP
ncbi:hypothetical protein L798_10208 [Zootermopsis nevadensis]|uniref:Uncharacterized protein n=1 Tax=Zootermopsis nevadensis TaxID=136037 RepID=A0A067QWI6_ZOONE|nr:hypothetical protein L798_10208 [Zootermopsis nevadensis]